MPYCPTCYSDNYDYSQCMACRNRKSVEDGILNAYYAIKAAEKEEKNKKLIKEFEAKLFNVFENLKNQRDANWFSINYLRLLFFVNQVSINIQSETHLKYSTNHLLSILSPNILNSEQEKLKNEYFKFYRDYNFNLKIKRLSTTAQTTFLELTKLDKELTAFITTEEINKNNTGEIIKRINNWSHSDFIFSNSIEDELIYVASINEIFSAKIGSLSSKSTTYINPTIYNEKIPNKPNIEFKNKFSFKKIVISIVYISIPFILIFLLISLGKSNSIMAESVTAQ